MDCGSRFALSAAAPQGESGRNDKVLINESEQIGLKIGSV
jgi:hypothetical protein